MSLLWKGILIGLIFGVPVGAVGWAPPWQTVSMRESGPLA